MSVSEARSIVPAVQVELLDPLAEAHDRGELLRAFERWSDHVQPVGDQDLLIEISRSARSLGGEVATHHRAVDLAARLGHRDCCRCLDRLRLHRPDRQKHR